MMVVMMPTTLMVMVIIGGIRRASLWVLTLVILEAKQSYGLGLHERFSKLLEASLSFGHPLSLREEQP